MQECLGFPSGKLSPQATERVYTYPLRPSLRSATSPREGRQGALLFGGRVLDKLGAVGIIKVEYHSERLWLSKDLVLHRLN